MKDESPDAKPRPPWLVGLMVAVVVFIILLIVVNLLGYGDEPAVGAMPAIAAVLTR